jgi:hypothetical protein
MEANLKRALCAIGMTVFLLSGSMWGQPWSDWASTANNVNIAYHFRLWENSKSCDIEFKDQNQGDGYTTFDAAVDYQTISDSNSTAPGPPSNNAPPNSNNKKAPNNNRVTKTDNLHIVTAMNHNGPAQISNCLGITEVRVSFIQRH